MLIILKFCLKGGGDLQVLSISYSFISFKHVGLFYGLAPDRFTLHVIISSIEWP